MELDPIVLKRHMQVCGIPSYMHEGLCAYIVDRKPVGHFLTAVLCCDFKKMCQHADADNQRALYQYFFFLYNYAPAACWGSKENVREWLTPPETGK